MAELPLDQAVPRFKENEDRLDTFVNSATGYTTSGGTSVQSIQQFLASIGSNGIDFVDGAKARFGTGNDLEIYHSGSGSFIRDTGTGDLTIDGSAISIQTASAERISVSASGINVTGTVEFDGLSGTGSVTITDIADEDNMASNSATKLATQQSIKAYVDAQVGSADTLSEVLGLGNTTGGTDIAVSANDDITFTDSSKAKFGAGSDLQIYHDGSNSYIKEVGTGNLFIDATSLRLRTGAGTETYMTADGNGSVDLYYDNTKVFETSASGIDVTGNIGLSSTQPTITLTDTDGPYSSYIAKNGSVLTVDGDSVRVRSTAGTEYMRVTSAGIDVTGNVEFDGLSGTGAVTVTDILDEDDMTSDSATALATQQSIKAYVDANAGGGSGGLPTTGGTMTGDILFNDSVKAKYGTSSDLQIFHDGSDSYITDSGTGILFLRTNQLKIQSDDGLETYGVFTDNGAVTLYHNNVEKLATTSSGIDVTGNVVGDGLTIAGDATFTGGGTGSIVINDEDSSLCPTMTFTRNGGGTTTNDFIKFENSGGEVATIDATGGAFLSKVSVNTSGASNSSNAIAIATSGTNFESDGGIISIDHAASGAVTGGYFSKYSAGGTLRHSVKGDGKGYFAGGIDVTGKIAVGDAGVIADHELHIQSASPTIRLEDTDGNQRFDITQNGGTTNIDYESGLIFKKADATEIFRIDGAGVDVTGITKTAGSGYNPANTGWATNAALITTGSYGGGLTMIDGSKAYSFHTLSGGEVLAIKQGATSGAATEKLRIDSTKLKVTGNLEATGNINIGASSAPTWDTGNRLWTESGWGSRYDGYQHRWDVGLTRTEAMRIDSSGNVGIGYTSLSHKLAVNGGVMANSGFMIGSAGDNYLYSGTDIVNLRVGTSGSYRYFQFTDTSSGSRIGTGSGKLSLGVSTNDYLTIDSSGNIGINNSSPSALLEIGNGNDNTLGTTAGDVLDNLHITSDTSNSDKLLIQAKRTATGTSWTSAAQRLQRKVDASLMGYMQYGSSSSDLITFGKGASTEYMRIDGSGNVGIGTTSPNHELHIESTSPTIRLVDTDGNNTIDIGQSGSACYIDFDNTVRFRNLANVERLRVDSGGIDVTGDLTVSSTIEVGSLTPNQDGAIEVGVIALGTPAIASTTSSTGLMNHIIFDNPNGAVGKINTLNSSTTYLTSSDYRLKTDVQAMTGSIDRVKALRPVNFEWVVDGTRVDGFLAHEAQEVVPEAVDGEKDAMRDQQYVESEATGDIYTPAVDATYETIQVELTPAVEAVYETVTVEISPAVEATYDEDGNELTPAIEAVTEEQEQLVTPAVDATYEEQQQELTPAIDEVIHSSDVVEPDELEEGQRWRETTEKVMATRQVPDYQGIDQSKIVPLLTSALQDAIAKIEALETRLEALEA